MYVPRMLYIPITDSLTLSLLRSSQSRFERTKRLPMAFLEVDDSKVSFPHLLEKVRCFMVGGGRIQLIQGSTDRSAIPLPAFPATRLAYIALPCVSLLDDPGTQEDSLRLLLQAVRQQWTVI